MSEGISKKFLIYCTHLLILPLPLKDHEVHGQNKPQGTEKFALSMSLAVVLHYMCL